MAKSRKFFLYLAYHHPHHPQYAGRVMTVSPLVTIVTSLFSGEKFHGLSARGTLGDSLAELDWSVGVLMNTLRRLKVGEDVLSSF